MITWMKYPPHSWVLTQLRHPGSSPPSTLKLGKGHVFGALPFQGCLCWLHEVLCLQHAHVPSSLGTQRTNLRCRRVPCFYITTICMRSRQFIVTFNVVTEVHSCYHLCYGSYKMFIPSSVCLFTLSQLTIQKRLLLGAVVLTDWEFGKLYTSLREQEGKWKRKELFMGLLWALKRYTRLKLDSYHVIQALRHTVVSGVQEVDFGSLDGDRTPACDLACYFQSSSHHRVFIRENATAEMKNRTKLTLAWINIYGTSQSPSLLFIFHIVQ